MERTGADKKFFFLGGGGTKGGQRVGGLKKGAFLINSAWSNAGRASSWANGCGRGGEVLRDSKVLDVLRGEIVGLGVDGWVAIQGVRRFRGGGVQWCFGQMPPVEVPPTTREGPPSLGSQP